MPETDPLSCFVERLERSGVPYMVTGSVASTVYGEPRLTHDIDLVAELRAADVEPFLAAFEEEGFYRPPRETVELEVGRPVRGRFNVIHHETGYKADVYLAGRDPLHRWALGRRVRVELAGLGLWLAPPEYVILRKLEYFREGGSEKHLRDIAAMLEVSAGRIDLDVVAAKVRPLGLGREWREALARAGR